MRRLHILFLIITDLVLIAAAFFLALLIRFEGHMPLRFIEGREVFYGLSFLYTLFVFYSFGLYRKVWRYAGVHELLTIFNAVTIAMIPVGGYVFFVHGTIYPRSSVVIAWLLEILMIGGIRFVLRFVNERQVSPRVSESRRVLLIGADDAGEMILRELKRHSNLGYLVVGIIDDDPAKKNMRIHGVPVMGPVRDLPYLINQLNIEEVIITTPNPAFLRNLISLTEGVSVKFKTIPSLSEIIDEKITVNKLRQVQIEDLLERDVVKLDLPKISRYLADKVVLITGAGGSIGSEIARQIVRFNPKKLILLGRGENSLHEIWIELSSKIKVPLEIFICDIRNIERLELLFKKENIQVIFHAAAHKHVHLMEANPGEAATNNIFGTLNLVNMSKKYFVERFVFLSTDKAVNPVSIMGKSKSWAEMVLRLNSEGGTKFISVRFGNVLDSKGSVIPTFKKQISLGGPVTVTDPNMTRFFMTIPEAVQLVIQAGAFGESGDVFILDMGKQVKIMDLARNMIRLSGLEPDIDIPIEVVGVRPGEKINEELLSIDEEKQDTEISKIFKVKCAEIDKSQSQEKLNKLMQFVKDNDEEAIRKIL
ncbi:MAG: nucleoside-diphosphate sugar epimerase/dehydratase [Armatimonadota bacterium]